MIDPILSRLGGVRANGDGYIACCPAHSDKSPSLSIRDTGDKVVLHCFAGCQTQDVLDAIGLEWADLFREERKRQDTRHLTAGDVERIGRQCLYSAAYLSQPGGEPSRKAECKRQLESVLRRYGPQNYERIVEWMDD